jgi:uncharacterized membrane protein YwzB
LGWGVGLDLFLHLIKVAALMYVWILQKISFEKLNKNDSTAKGELITSVVVEFLDYCIFG